MFNLVDVPLFRPRRVINPDAWSRFRRLVSGPHLRRAKIDADKAGFGPESRRLLRLSDSDGHTGREPESSASSPPEGGRLSHRPLGLR
jgi:hypothetical protein